MRASVVFDKGDEVARLGTVYLKCCTGWTRVAVLVLLLCRVRAVLSPTRVYTRRHSGGDGGGSNSPSRKFSFKASTCVAVGYAIPHSAVTVGCRVGLRLPVFSLAALPALRCRTSDVRRSEEVSEAILYRTSPGIMPRRGRLHVRQL